MWNWLTSLALLVFISSRSKAVFCSVGEAFLCCSQPGIVLAFLSKILNFKFDTAIFLARKNCFEKFFDFLSFVLNFSDHLQQMMCLGLSWSFPTSYAMVNANNSCQLGKDGNGMTTNVSMRIINFSFQLIRHDKMTNAVFLGPNLNKHVPGQCPGLARQIQCIKRTCTLHLHFYLDTSRN